MKEFSKIYNIEMYKRDVLVHFGSIESLFKMLKKYLPTKEAIKCVSCIKDGTVGITFSVEKGIIVWLPEVPSNSESCATLIHEIFHVAVGIMRYIGVELTDASNESYAYLIEFLSKKILKDVLNYNATKPINDEGI